MISPFRSARRITFMLATVTVSLAATADTVMVRSKSADLYLDKRRQRSIQAGTIVESNAHPRHNKEWLIVNLDGKKYEARRRHFATLATIQERYDKDVIDIDAGITLAETRVAEIHATLDQIAEDTAGARLDRTVILQIPIAVKITKDKAKPVKTREQAVEIEYRTVDLLTTAAFRKLNRGWKKEQLALNKEYEKLRKGLLELELRWLAVHDQWESTRWRFKRYALSDEDARAERYVVTGRSAPVYMKNVKVAELANGNVVTAAPHPRHREWLVLTHSGQRVSGHGRYFLSEDIGRHRLNADIIRTQSAIRHLTHTSSHAKFEIEVIDTLARQLHYRKHVRSVFVEFPQHVARGILDKNTHLNCPVGTRVRIQRRRLRRLERHWAREKGDFERTFKSESAALIKKRKELVTLKARLKAFTAKFES